MKLFLPLSVLIAISLAQSLPANQGFIVPDEAIPSVEQEVVPVTSYENEASYRTVYPYVDSRRCMRQYPYSSYGPRGVDHYYMPSSPYYDPRYGYNSFRPLNPRPRCRYSRGYNGWDN